MGRFYKTAKPDFVDDVIFQPPWELAKEVIQGKDDAVAKSLEEQDALDLLTENIDALQIDEGVSNDYIDSIRGKADELSKSMQGDLLNAGKYSPKIRSLTKELRRSLDSGLLGKTKEQYAGKDTEFKRLDALAAKDGKLSQKVEGLKKRMATEYEEKGGLSYKSKDEYNKFIENEVNPTAKFDDTGFLTGLQSHFAKNQTAYASSGPDSQGYIWTKKGTTESIDGDAVKNYMRKTPEMERWRQDIGQDIELAGFNDLGLRGKDLEDYKTETLKNAEEDFIDAAAERIGFKKETKDARVTTDSKYLAEYAQANKLNTPDIVKTEVVVDRRSDIETANDSDMLDLIQMDLAMKDSKVFSSDNQALLLKQLAEAKNNGSLETTLKELNLPISGAEVKNLLEHTDKVGVRTNLIDVENKNYSPKQKMQYAEEAKAVFKAVSEIDVSENYEIQASQNYALYGSEPLNGKAIMELINSGEVDINNFGGSQKTIKTKIISPSTTDDEGRKVWRNKNNKIITHVVDGEKTYPSTAEEAKAIDPTIRMEDNVKYVNVLGNKVAIKDVNVSRFKSVTGQKDDYEMEFVLQRVSEKGEVYFEKGVVKVPNRNVKVISTNKE